MRGFAALDFEVLDFKVLDFKVLDFADLGAAAPVFFFMAISNWRPIRANGALRAGIMR